VICDLFFHIQTHHQILNSFDVLSDKNVGTFQLLHAFLSLRSTKIRGPLVDQMRAASCMKRPQIDMDEKDIFTVWLLSVTVILRWFKKREGAHNRLDVGSSLACPTFVVVWGLVGIAKTVISPELNISIPESCTLLHFDNIDPPF
jgi:hypothetical protein